MNEVRVLTVAMMSMSSISGAIVGAYVQMIPGELVLTAIPLNIINAIIVASILNPVTVEEKEDIIYSINNDEKLNVNLSSHFRRFSIKCR